MESLERAVWNKSIELRFVGLANSLEKRKKLLNHLFNRVYCPVCDSKILADFHGGIVKDKYVKFLYYSCPDCFYPLIVRPEQNKLGN